MSDESDYIRAEIEIISNFCGYPYYFSIIPADCCCFSRALYLLVDKVVI